MSSISSPSPTLAIPAVLTEPLTCRKCFTSRSLPLLVQSEIFYQYLALQLREYFLIAFLRRLSITFINSCRYQSVLNIFEDAFLQLLMENENYLAPEDAFEKCRDRIRSKYIFEVFDEVTREEIGVAFVEACIEIGDFCYENFGSPKGCLHRYFEKRLATNRLLEKLKLEYGSRLTLDLFPHIQEISTSFSARLKPIIARLDPERPEGIPVHKGLGSSILNHSSVPITESDAEIQARYVRNIAAWRKATMTSFRTMIIRLKKESLLIIRGNRAKTRNSALESIVDYCLHSEQEDLNSLNLFTEQLEFGITFSVIPEPVKPATKLLIELANKNEEEIESPTTSSTSASTISETSTSTSIVPPISSATIKSEKNSGSKTKRKLRRQLEAEAKFLAVEKVVVEEKVLKVEEDSEVEEEPKRIINDIIEGADSSLLNGLQTLSLTEDRRFFLNVTTNSTLISFRLIIEDDNMPGLLDASDTESDDSDDDD